MILLMFLLLAALICCMFLFALLTFDIADDILFDGEIKPKVKRRMKALLE